MSLGCVVYVKLDGQLSTGPIVSVTVTLKRHELVRPALSLAVHVTGVVPILNIAGLNVEAAGLQLTRAIPLPSVAVGVYDVSEMVALTPLLGVAA